MFGSKKRKAAQAAIIQEAVDKATAPLKEALSNNLLQPIDKEDSEFRRITGPKVKTKDLEPITHERMLKIAYHLSERNPLANRILSIKTDFIVGDGIIPEFDKNTDDKVKEVIKSFWNDSINNFPLNQHKKVRELGLYGEQCYPVFVNKTTGRVRLGYLDPLCIDKVLTDPDNCEVVTTVVVKGDGGNEGQKLEVIRVDEDPQSESFGMLKGDCFYFSINNVSNSPRGRSDLLPLADWLDAYDQFIFNRLERTAYMNNFVWDVTLEGMDEEAIRTWLKNNPAPKPGSIRAHNERVIWNAVSPDLKSNDAKTDADLVLGLILGGAGFPKHWFATGEGTNRATAAEMGEPTLKTLKARQSLIVKAFSFMIRFQLDQAVLAKTIKSETNQSFSLAAPDISQKDTETITKSFNNLSTGISKAVFDGYLSIETGSRLLIEVANELNLQINPEEELVRIENQEIEDDNQDIRQPEGNDE